MWLKTSLRCRVRLDLDALRLGGRCFALTLVVRLLVLRIRCSLCAFADFSGVLFSLASVPVIGTSETRWRNRLLVWRSR